MRYQVLFLVNHGTIPCVLTVETPKEEPHVDIARHADLLVKCDARENMLGLYGDAPYVVVKDRMGFFTPHEPVSEEAILNWLKNGKTMVGAAWAALQPHRRKVG